MDLYNSTTLKWVKAYIKNPTSTVLIETNGYPESGLNISKYIYEKLIKSKNTPFFVLSLKDKKSIGVEDVRELKSYMALKADENYKYTRFVTIKDAEFLTIEAQNALLKLIEELPERTILVLISNDSSKILETIHSRCFSIKVLPLEFKKAQKYTADNNIDELNFRKSYLMSEGNTSVFLDLIHNKDNELINYVNNAKQFIGADIFKRQILLQDYLKNKIDNNKFIKAMQLVSKTAMRSASSIENKNKWKIILEKSLNAEKQLNSNVNSKLVLLSLSISI
jgi:DNA polymerase III delta prime subunit